MAHTQTRNSFQKPTSAYVLWVRLNRAIRHLTGRASGRPNLTRMTEQEIKTLGQVHPDARKLFSRPISTDAATQLAMRANGHSLLR